jgi:hypothetical protein
MSSKKHMVFQYENNFLKYKKIGHGGCTRNRISSATTVTELLKTFLVFYKWPNLTDIQVVLCSTVCIRLCIRYYVYSCSRIYTNSNT